MNDAARLRVEQVTAAGDLGTFRKVWESLAERAPHAELFETPLWLTAWLDTYWKDRPIAFMFVRSGEELVGLAPLLDDRDGTLGCPDCLATPVNPHARRCSLLAVGDAAPVVEAVLAHLEHTRRHPRMRLRCCDALSPVVAAIEGRRPRALIRQKEANPIIRLEGDWDSYLASRPGHLRHELARKQKRLEAEWEAKWVHVADAAGVERAMTEVLRIERNSWKHPTGTSLVSEPGAAAFYGRIARNAAAAGWLRVELLYLDGEPVAHILGVAYRGTYYALKTSYDEAYRAWSPGVVLFQHAIRKAFEDGLHTFDFLGADARWKSELANDRRAHVEACAFAASALRCRWDRFRVDRVKPFLEERAPALLALRRRVLDGPADAGD
ncbi:MAG: GNAT family N-acetyltransferase [Acidimicrobiia bacterium]|nr:GNAT family N-acetyltransferase [Acidimicrobiia bacterium]